MSNALISLVVFVPLLGALLQAFFATPISRWIAITSSLGASLLVLGLMAALPLPLAAPSLEVAQTWVGAYAVGYELALDGLNALPLILVAILFPVLIAAEWQRPEGPRGLHGLILCLQTATLGVLCAHDLFLQFFFLGLTTLPFYFMIAIWGGSGRESAASHYMTSAALSSSFLFFTLVLIYYAVDPHTFSLRELVGGKIEGKSFWILGYELSVSTTTFCLLGAGLALRAPIWPIHGWFTETADEAPHTVFVAMSAGVVPVVLYVLLRDAYALFPEIVRRAAPLIAGIGVVNILMGVICAGAQTTLSGLTAFICVTEVGMILVGIGSLSPLGIVGAVYHQLIVGLGLAGLGLCAGIIRERTTLGGFVDERGSSLVGGVALQAPQLTVVAGIIVASLLGFPGLAGFVGHALVLIGSFALHPILVVVAGFAFLLASSSLFRMYRCVFLGVSSMPHGSFVDLTPRERAYFLPIVGGLIFFGLYPKPLFEVVRPIVLTILSCVR